MENLYPLLSLKVIFRKNKKGEKYRSTLFTINGDEIKLNDVSERVIIECDGGSSVTEIAAKLAADFDETPHEDIRSRLRSLLASLKDQGAIEFLGEPAKGRRRRILPLQPYGKHPLVSMFMEVTNACNLRCSHCYLGDIEERHELPLEDIKRVLDQYSEMGGEHFVISGGEPFCRKDLFEIIEFASSLPLFISILSNGTLIDKDTAKNLSQNNIKHIQISLDGANPETHDTYRGMRGAHKAAIRAIESLVHEGIKVDIATTINRLNMSELCPLIDLCERWDIMPEFSYQLPKGRAVVDGKNYQLTYHEHFKALIKVNQHIAENTGIKPFNIKVPAVKRLDRARCSAGLTSISVRSNGDISACLEFDDPRAVLGNVKEDSISEIWNSDNSFLQMLRNSTLEDLAFCRDCRHFRYCKAGCPAVAYDVWGDYNMPDPKPCIYFTMAREHLTIDPVDKTDLEDQTYIIRCDK